MLLLAACAYAAKIVLHKIVADKSRIFPLFQNGAEQTYRPKFEQNLKVQVGGRNTAAAIVEGTL